jgi:heterodisulfide reductase subunit A
VTAPPPPGPAAAPLEPDASRIGLVFCRCGPNLFNLIELGPLEEAAHWPEAAAVTVQDILCGEAGQAWLAGWLQAERLDRLVVAACSPREHELTFRAVMARAGRNPYLLHLVNLREQVEWIGGAAEEATARAERLVRAGLARVARHQPRERREVDVVADVVVVGGGAAGVAAALSLARKDRKVLLVERSPALGGLAAQLDEIFPDHVCASCFMEPALDEVLHHERIELLTGATVTRVRGSAGAFEVTAALAPRFVDPLKCIGCGECSLRCPVEQPDPWSAGLGTRRAIGAAYTGSLPHVAVLDAAACLHHRDGSCDACLAACGFDAIRLDARPSERTLTAGALVLATGFRPGQVDPLPGVISSWQLERLLHPGGPTGGKLELAGRPAPASVLLASTAGDQDGALPSRELLKLARGLRRRSPGLAVAVSGGLGRTPGLQAEAGAAVEEGVTLLDEQLLPDGLAPDGAAVSARLALGPLQTTRSFDLVVLHAASTPAEGTEALAALLRLDRDRRGFLAEGSANPFEPTATRVAGVFVAGAAAGPRSIREAIRDGAAAAGRVLATLVPGERHELTALAAEIDPVICGGCGTCTAACPYHAVISDPVTHKASVEAAHCHACGGCAAACPTGAASAPHSTRAQLTAEISALLASARVGAVT